jgi:TonB family protein
VPTSVQEGIAYMNYFEALRNKIQESVRYPKEWSIGEVYVSFIIKSDGSLKLDAINVLDKSSTNNKLLREASIQTITAAAPFPPFPKGLNRQEICFNIPIVYKSGK